MKIRNIEVDFDFLDADDVERFENEARKVVEKCKVKEKENMTHAQAIREECKVINDFFDGVFGQGTSQKLFAGKNNLGNHIKAFEDIVKAKNEKQMDFQNTLDRYQPNRQERRYNKYQKRK